MGYLKFAAWIACVVLVASAERGVQAVDETERGSSTTKLRFNVDLSDLDGRLHVLRDNDRQVVRAFVFVSTTCPISNY